MNLTLNNQVVPKGAVPRSVRHPLAPIRRSPLGRLRIGAGLSSILSAFFIAGHAFAQAAAAGDNTTIGGQITNMATEGANAGSAVGAFAMYGAALLCFVGGVWALWQSRQAQNRESGKVAMGLAGVVLCGLFAAGGVWINKAANTTSGGNATQQQDTGKVQFGNGG